MACNIDIDRNSDIPLHEQLSTALREQIRLLAAGSRLPSENALCRKYKLSRLTVARALNQLTQEGYIKRIKGSGSFVDNPTPLNIYYLLPCIEAVKNPRKFQTMYVYAGALSKTIDYGCRLETLIASPGNIAWEVDESVIRRLPEGSRIIVFGSWLRDIFPVINERKLQVAYINLQAEKGERTLEYIASWHHITVDRTEIIHRLIDKLIENKHKHIAFLHNYSHYLNPYLTAYREALRRNNVEYVPELICSSVNDEMAVQYALRHLLDFRDVYFFDTIITADAQQAKGVVKYLRRHNLMVPEDIAVISLNHSLFDACSAYAQVELPFEEAGKLAVEYLCGSKTDTAVLYASMSLPEDSAWDFLR